MKLGIFDSGIGGRIIAESLKKSYPKAEFVIINDHEHVPYGEKSTEEIINLTDNAIQPLLTSNCDIIVIACNTATAVAIEYLRKKYSHQKFIGIEPMVKPASKITKSNIIAVFATPATLASHRYQNLVEKYGQHLTILEPDCSNWASMIENNHINQQEIAKVVKNVSDQGADVIVLGCTHYHWIKTLITKLAGTNIKVIEPSKAISRQVGNLLKLC